MRWEKLENAGWMTPLGQPVLHPAAALFHYSPPLSHPAAFGRRAAVGLVERKLNRVIKSSPDCCPHPFFLILKPQEIGPKFCRNQ